MIRALLRGNTPRKASSVQDLNAIGKGLWSVRNRRLTAGFAPRTGVRGASEIDTSGISAYSRTPVPIRADRVDHKGGHRGSGIPPGEWETQEIEIGMDHVKIGNVSECVLH